MNDFIFIKMCKEVLEIQGEWKLKVGDFFVRNCSNLIYCLEESELDVINHGNGTKSIIGSSPMKHSVWIDGKTWLPRQDQLQKMWFRGNTGDYKFSVYELENKFNEWCNESTIILYSMEQLWLAFIMHELYNKVWNGTTWEKKDV